MQARRYALLTAMMLSAMTMAPAFTAATWDIDPSHSTAQFKVRHMMVSNVTGDFGKVTGVINYDPADLAKSSIEATIDATTIDTRSPDRDKHLKGPEFFDAEKFPTITFKSKKFEKAGEGKLKVTGDLTMHGVTKEVVLDVEASLPEVKDGRGNIMSGASATTKINRQEFGVSWSKTLDGGGLAVSDEVWVNIELELKKKV